MRIIQGDALKVQQTLDSGSVQTCITSPPYFGLRDYHCEGQLGLEKTPGEYVEKLVVILREVKRVLRNDGTLWLNLGDTYTNTSTPGGGDPTIGVRNTGNSKYTSTMVSGLPAKSLIGIPWHVAFALQADGWILRQDIIWHKPNPMPESVTDRCTKAHEYIFLLSKNKKYYCDMEAIKEEATGYDGRKDTLMKGSAKYKTSVIPGQSAHTMASNGHERWEFKDGVPVRNKRSVWTVSTKPYKGAHFATFPPDLVKPCILAGCPKGGIVMDIFSGRATTGMVALREGRDYLGIELNPLDVEESRKRIKDD